MYLSRFVLMLKSFIAVYQLHTVIRTTWLAFVCEGFHCAVCVFYCRSVVLQGIACLCRGGLSSLHTGVCVTSCKLAM